MSSIGGYFELELSNGQEYHKNAIRLNTGRNAFEYILRAKQYEKVYLPYYSCDALLEPINKLGLKQEFYQINDRFYPIFDHNTIKKNECFIYPNYFGLQDHIVKSLSIVYPNLIIDNSQAFYSKPLSMVDTFYSPRKFFGVPDGAYLYTDKILEDSLETDNSSARFGHLIDRIEYGVEASYSKFKENEQCLSSQPIKQMSNITHRLLQSIDYEKIAGNRIRNFQFLHERLGSQNLINIDSINSVAPLAYPFISKKDGVRDYLIQNKIFIACYWPNVFDWVKKDSLEYIFAKKMSALPIDQRYKSEDLTKICNLIL